MPYGANMAQRTLNGRWCQYDTKGIKCQVVPVTDIGRGVMATATLVPPDF